jgi:UDP-3-O-[3-hydroxymyristoyl] glucosamine N-acyltransferase
MQRAVGEIAEFVGGSVVGDGAAMVSGVASVGSAKVGDLVFVEDRGGLEAALLGGASAILAGEFAGGAQGKTVVVVEHPRLAFARAVAWLSEASVSEGGGGREVGVHGSAVVHASARLGVGVAVGALAVIGENAVIGDGSWIGAGVVIGAGVMVGKKCEIYPRVVIYAGTSLGDRIILHAGAVLGSDGFGYVRDGKTGRYENFPQMGTLRIGDDVEIGANTTIDRGALEATVIGRGSKIDNLVHIGHNVVMGEDVVLAAQVGISGSCVIGDGVVMGGQAGIGDHAHIEAGVILGGQSGVLPKKVTRGKGVVFWGTPARPLREYLKQLAALARLGRKG